ncbi:MAG: fumarylacetoacetate hydrolase family protein [Ottowia sp.]
MTAYVFPPPARPAVAVRGASSLYAVSRIFCVGRNYAGHAREMGSDPAREPPFYFCKSPAALAPSGAAVPYPPGTDELHHEVELVVAIGRSALRIAPEQALDCVWGYACGLDMTRRDLQAAAKAKGRPWSLAKDFENAAVISPLAPASAIGHPQAGRIHLSVNGQLRQQGDLAEMIWSVPEVIANLSQYYRLQPGDLIYTGTPEGVGEVRAGDALAGGIEGVGEVALTIA